MTAQEIRKKYFEFMVSKGHKLIPRANLVPQDDPTTLFTGSGMQPLIPYLLGELHPEGKRLVNSQTSLRSQDIDEVGDNRHTTFFEMLGNWSLGDYFKKEQLGWFWEFLTQELKLDPTRLYASVFIGDEQNKIPKDTESAQIWKDLFKTKDIDAKDVEIGAASDGGKTGMQDGRIFYYDAKENWWSRAGTPEQMPAGEPGGPDSEVFYEFPNVVHDKKYGEHCHPACDCGRFIEIGNSVFMEYIKNKAGGFDELPQKNVDYGGGLERIAAAVIDSPDVFKVSVIWPIIEELEKLSDKSYQSNTESMRVIADHMRGAFWLAVDGVVPSNKAQGYVMRRLIRRAIRFAFDLGVEQGLATKLSPIIFDIFKDDFPEVAENADKVITVLEKEEQIFRQTLRKGLQEFEKMMKVGTYPMTIPAPLGPKVLGGKDIFILYDTYGFPTELSLEEAFKSNLEVSDSWKKEFEELMQNQRQRSQTASAGTFKGGLADHSEQVVKYHTVTHLMYQALKQVLGDHIAQRGSNITAERTRFDFSQPEKMTPVQIAEVEKTVNEKIAEDLPVTWKEEKTEEAFAKGANGAFGDKYGDTVKVYTIGDENNPYSREICGGPHVEHTGVIGEGGKKFKITKEESVSSGVRRIKAILQ